MATRIISASVTYASEGARDAVSGWDEGDVVYVTGVGYTVYDGSAWAALGGGGGGVTVTDGTTTVDPTTSLTVTSVTEGAAGEATIGTLPPGMGYDADDLMLEIDGVDLVGIRWTQPEEPANPFLILTSNTVSLMGADFLVAANDGNTYAMTIDSASGTVVYVGGGMTFAVEDQSGTPDYFKVDGAGAVTMAGLPTADPVAAGQLWNDAGTLKVSAG